MKNLFLSGIAITLGWCFLQIGLAIDTIGESSVTAAVNIQQKDSNTLNGRWYLQAVLPSDTAAGKTPTISFDLAKNSFTGNTGCNRMNGTFRKTDTSLVFNERIVTTKMACPGYNEPAFLKSLLRTNNYKFERGTLILMFDATELSRWTRTQEKVSPIKKT